MKDVDSKIRKFIGSLLRIAAADNRRDMALLRRYVMQDDIIGMLSVVVPIMPEGVHADHERKAYYFVASLFGCHPQHARVGNLGKSFAMLANRSGSNSIEMRLQRLITASRDDVYQQLHGTFMLLKSHNIAVDYGQLLDDLIFWGDLRKQRWAESYYRFARPAA